MSLIINGARRRIIFRGMLVLAAYLLIFSPCMGNDDNHLLLWMTNRTNGVMSGQADGLHNPTVRWSTSKGAVDDQIYDMFLLSTAKNPYFEVYIDETATNYGFKVNCTPVWKSVYGKYERYFYVSGFYVASTSDATKIKAFSIPGDQIWSRSLNLSEIGVNKGLLDSNLIVKWDRGASSHLRLSLSNDDPIPYLQGLWYTDNEPPSRLFIDVSVDGNGVHKLSLVPGSSTKDRGLWTSLTYYGVPSGDMITGNQIIYNMPSLPKMDAGGSITYEIGRLGKGPLTLTQKSCGGFPTAAKGDPKQAASISWWEKAKTLTKAKFMKIPDDLASITGLYFDNKSKKLVYVGYDEPKDASAASVTFIPDVSVPLPEPPVYPGWGDIVPIKCYGLKSGYVITGSPNRWCKGNKLYSLLKFSYHITEDLNGNPMLVQDDCDFSGMPDQKSVTWWKNAKVLIKLTQKEQLMVKQNNGEINLSQDVNANFTGKNGKID